MTRAQRIGRVISWTVTAAGLMTAAYRTVSSLAWLRYGHPARPHGDDIDPVLDRFMPQYEVADRHRIHIRASAELAMRAADEINLEDSSLIRAIVRARALLLGADEEGKTGGGQVFRPGFISQMTSIGWGKLAERPGREIVMGAVTRPWEANVVFRPVPADRFAAFQEPDYVKIIWTLRADSCGPSACVFRTETRVMTTDADARARFRTYWAKFSPGIVLIRRVLLKQVRKAAERRARAELTG